MANVSIIIDGQKISAPAESSILSAAESIGIKIPTLCHIKEQSAKANCRVCLVEVNGAKTLQPSCATRVVEGMEIRTNTQNVRAARKMSLQLILANHPIDCYSCVRLDNCLIEDLDPKVCESCFYCDCVRDEDCELQKLAEEYEINQLVFDWKEREEGVDTSTASIIRNPNKCITCHRCVDSCGEIQNVNVWAVTNRGGKTRVSTANMLPLSQTACVECGQCVRNCPVASIFESQDYNSILDATQDKANTVIARIEPYFMEEYYRIAKTDPEEVSMGNFIAGLKRIGVDAVVANDAAREQTETASKEELARKSDGPIISSNCPATVSFVKKNYPMLEDLLSKVDSPSQAFGRKQKENAAAVTVSLTPCSARKMEAARDGDNRLVDLVLSPREIHRIFTRSGSTPKRLPPVDFDSRDKKNTTQTAVERDAGIFIGEIDLKGLKKKVASAYGLRSVRELLQQVEEGSCNCDYIQLQACPEGCISTNSWLVK